MFLFGFIIFRVLLDLCYVYYMNPTFERHFLTPMPLNFEIFRYLLSLIVLVVPLLFLPLDKEDMSGVFFVVVLIFVFAPMTSMVGMNSERALTAPIMTAIAMMWCLFVSRHVFSNFTMPIVRNGERRAMTVAVAMVVMFLAWSVVSGAVRQVSFSLDRIYEVREVTGAELDIGPLAYINAWSQKVCGPFLLAYGLATRRRALFGFALTCQVYFFAVTQHRAHLFVPILIIAVYALYKRSLSLARLTIIAGFGLASLLAAALAFGLVEVPAVLIRRALFVPSSVALDWVDYFQGHDFVYWSDSLLAPVGATDYTGKLLPYVVGDHFAPNSGVAFNSGLIGAGYAQAGLLGIVIYATFMGLVLRFVNVLIRQGLPTYFAVAVLLAPIRSAWADSDVLTAFLSHGVGIGILLLALMGAPRAVASAGVDRPRPLTMSSSR